MLSYFCNCVVISYLGMLHFFLNILYTSIEGNLIMPESTVSLRNHYVSVFHVQTSCDIHKVVFIVLVTKLLHHEGEQAVRRLEGKRLTQNFCLFLFSEK